MNEEPHEQNSNYTKSPEVPPDLAIARLRFFRASLVAFHRVLSLMGMSAPEVM